METTLIEQLKQQIIEQFKLEDIQPEDIDPDAPLFDSNLDLDSIDALGLIVLLDREYNIKIKNKEEGYEVFHTLSALATFIEDYKQL